MSKRLVVEPSGILLGDRIVNFRPYSDNAPTHRPVKVEEVERRRGCHGTHVNGSACVTVAVEVERS